MLRLATAAVLAPLLWIAIKRAPAWLFFLFVSLMILAASWECYRMLRGLGARPFNVLGLAATAAVLATFLPGARPVQPGHVVLAAVLVATVASIWRRSDPGRMLATIAYTVFPVIFIGLTMGHVIALRETPVADGTDLVLLLFICIIFGDTSAYYVGTMIGKHKLAPRISPNKSWEGAVGAMLGSLLGAVVAHLWFYQRLPLIHAVILGVILGAAGLLGDLAESAVKRACGVKDSSSLLPGHGGCFDRTDSLLFAAPLLYYYYVFFLWGRA